MMKNFKIFLLWCAFIAHSSFSQEVHGNFEENSQLTEDSEARGRRDVIEEEKYYNIHSDNKNIVQPTPWIPHSLDDPTTKISITNDDVKEVLPLYQTTERVTDRPTGRGARASNENWIKLPFPGRDDSQDDLLSPPQPSGELINSRMPRVNFVTQNKALEASESRNDKGSIQRPSRNDDIRTEFVRPGEEREKQYRPVYPRQAIYYPEESRRYNIDDRYYPVDDLYRRDPYMDTYDRRRPALYPPIYPGVPVVAGPRVERYDEAYDNVVPRKPKRIIYYAHLPEVVRTPPSVDLRYRYTVDPYRRYDDDMYARTGRYDYRFRNPRPYPPNPYPYAPLRKEERNYRDLAGAGSAVKDKKVEEKVTPTPILPKKADESYKNNNANRNTDRNLINSHQYHDGSTYNNHLNQKAYPDVVRHDDGYLRYEEPLFHGTVEDPYQRKY